MSTVRNPNTISSRALAAQAALLKAIKSTKIADIDYAIAQWEPLAQHIPVAHPDYEPVLASYAVALLLRWEDSHQIKDIRKAILTLENALTKLSNVASRSRYQNLANLGAAYMDRYETFRTDPKDIMRAAECWEQAHTVGAALGYTRESANKILINLGEAYFFAYEVGAADIEAVHQSIKYFRIVLEHGAPEKHGSCLYRIGQCYSTLYARKKDNTNLDAAIENLEAATQHELDREDRQGALMELSRTLARKYDLTRANIDLDNAIRWARVAVEENQEDPLILRNLANLLYWKYKDMKDTASLTEAIDYYEVIWALYQRKPGKNMASYHFSFGTALIRRFDEAKGYGRLQDIERAVDLLELAVKSASPQCLDDYQHRLKGAISRRDKAHANPNASPQSTIRSSNTVGFPSLPASPTAISFAEPTIETPRHSKIQRRAPIPSLASRPEAATISSTSLDRTSKASEGAASKASEGVASRASEGQRPPSVRSTQSTLRDSQASQATIVPVKKGPPAPSLLSESMSVMTVPAVQDLPPSGQQQARPRVLRRATRSVPVVPLAKPPPTTKVIAGSPEKPRFLSFARLRGSKSP